MNGLEELWNFGTELVPPRPPDYGVARREETDAYIVDFRLVTGVRHGKNAASGLDELHRHIDGLATDHPAVVGMQRYFEVVFTESAVYLMRKRMRGERL
ncbi:hypothetical protein [Amycolatopsis sp. cmx-4-68]|uniref:hypothetical protein n=1 Tax=Amycolatopsis sp. cmx-4-68 TaxID=2790938 RepID=UPI00397A5559